MGPLVENEHQFGTNFGAGLSRLNEFYNFNFLIYYAPGSFEALLSVQNAPPG